ncbi:DUF4422 domain-containing protein [Liquorilactobacillus sicerae]|uniref:DUF4422 domain-containing protein n=1 Tax=Liquorilactobacillus sicerae TaxID=1416943 RepID=UPI0024806BDD
MEAEIYVVSHKKIVLPNNDLYYPIQVGSKKERFPGFLQDDQGQNIANKNPHYCELTAQYWAWKNRQTKIQGIVHYRRFFANHFGRNKVIRSQPFDQIITNHFINQLLAKHQMILPPASRFFEHNLWAHYRFQHQLIGLSATRRVIQRDFPAYLPAFEQVMFHQRKAHMYNMLITYHQIFNNYSQWLFSILEKVEEQVDISNFSVYEQRIFGFLSEFLLNIWVKHNQIDFVEVPLILTESRNYLAEACQFAARRCKFSDNK